jgi:hypothetical protein
MELNKLNEPLEISEIDFRVQSINKGGYATILAYKDARVDINRLNKICGVLGWQRAHTRDNKNCIVSIWDGENKQWVSKEDTGTESMAEAAKGLASDSFKRACFNLGIGIELYDYPVIKIKLNANEWELFNGKQKQTWDLKLKEWIWSSEFNGNKLVSISCNDEKGNLRFKYGGSLKVKNEKPIVTVDHSNKSLPWLKVDDANWKKGLNEKASLAALQKHFRVESKNQIEYNRLLKLNA